MEKLITQFGISIMRIKTSVITKSARKISDIGLFCCPSEPVNAGKTTKQNAQIKRTIKEPIV